MIASGTDFSFSDDNTSAEAAVAPTSTVSDQAIAIATFSAAPVRALPTATPDASMEVALAAYDPAMVDRGEKNFLGICSACHGTDAKGISGLGKPLLGSEFVRSNDDQALLAFVTVGRAIWDPANTTGVAMPARGGNPGLTDSDILSIIAYIRTIDGFVPGSGTSVANVVQPTPAPTVEITDEDLAFTPFMVIEGDPLGSSQPATDTNTEPVSTDRDGQAVYDLLCGVNYGGVTICDYLKQELDNGTSEDVLFQTMVDGLSSLDPNNTSGINIPPRGGTFPELTDGEINNLLHFIKTGENEPAAAPASDAAPTTEDRDGAAVYDALCGVNYGGVTVCDYLKQELANGTSEDTLFQTMVDGLSSFDANNTSGINIPPRGGTFPELTDGEIKNLIEYIKTLP